MVFPFQAIVISHSKKLLEEEIVDEAISSKLYQEIFLQSKWMGVKCSNISFSHLKDELFENFIQCILIILIAHTTSPFHNPFNFVSSLFALYFITHQVKWVLLIYSCTLGCVSCCWSVVNLQGAIPLGRLTLPLPEAINCQYLLLSYQDLIWLEFAQLL